jgi:Tfp pilus assembly protein PilF
MSKLHFLAAFTVASLLLSQASATAAGAEFPGKGEKKDWVRAAKIYDQALSQRKRGNVDRAMKMYEEAISIYPYDADFYYNLAIHYNRDKKDYKHAEELMQKAVELKPNSYSMNWEYAAALLAQGKLDEAKAVLDKAKTLKKTSEQEAELSETLKKIADAKK